MSSVLDQIGLKHPIVSNTHNICELFKLEKLDILEFKVLKSVCDLNIETNDIGDKRRKHT